MQFASRLSITFLLGLSSFFVLFNAKAETAVFDEIQRENAEQLMQQALKSDLAYEIVESLTTEIGPRLAGSEAEDRARVWGKKLGEELDFDRVVVEEFDMPFWDRGELHIALESPYKQELYGTALGGAGPSERKINAPVVYFRNIHELKKVKAGELRGKIAFVDGDIMVKSQVGAGYAEANTRRRVGWQHAERGGAQALVVRSVGSDSRRFPHTGMMSKLTDEAKKDRWADIPVIAISNPDADHLRRLHNLDKLLAMSINSRSKWKGSVVSGNVVMDLIGSEKPDEIVLIGGHLDSWDLGTGALDDGAGVAITTAAAALISQLPKRPKRTIRVVMFGAEEVGLLGARAYAFKHAGNLKNHVVATESDFGARTIWQLVSNVNADANVVIDEIAKLIRPLGIVRGGSEVPGGGPDIIPMAMQGVPTIRLSQNGDDYFDFHHTPDDTLDKIEKDELAQNVAAYAATIYLIADSEAEFRKAAVTEKAE